MLKERIKTNNLLCGWYFFKVKKIVKNGYYKNGVLFFA